MQLPGTCQSRNLRSFPTRTAFNPHAEDGTVRHYLVEDRPGLSQPDILGEFGGLMTWRFFKRASLASCVRQC